MFFINYNTTTNYILIIYQRLPVDYQGTQCLNYFSLFHPEVLILLTYILNWPLTFRLSDFAENIMYMVLVVEKLQSFQSIFRSNLIMMSWFLVSDGFCCLKTVDIQPLMRYYSHIFHLFLLCYYCLWSHLE